MNILRNRAKCNYCKDIIESKHTHDFVCCSCFVEGPENTGIYVDGGKEYLKRGGRIENYTELSEYTDDFLGS